MSDRQKDTESQGVQGDLVQNSSDVTMLARLSRHPEWQLPEEYFDEVPKAMAEIVRDPTKSARQKTAAAKLLVTMHGQNHAHTAGALTVHQRAENVKPFWSPRRAVSDDGPVSYLEDASPADLRETAKVLADLGILQRLANEAEPVDDVDQSMPLDRKAIEEQGPE